MMGTLLADIRHAFRGLFARPGVSLVAMLMFALGMGANTAIFSVLHSLYLAPLDYPNGERLVDIHNVHPDTGMDYANISIPEYLERKEQAGSLQDLAIYTGVSLNLAEEGTTPERVIGSRTSPSLFSTLGVQPVWGRTFDSDDAVPGKDKVVVIGHDLWRNRFNSDPGIVGRQLRLSGEGWRVIGVMPEGFGFPRRNTQLWMPLAMTPEQRAGHERENAAWRSIGLLREGARLEGLNAELASIDSRHAERMAAPHRSRQAENVQARAVFWRELQVGANRSMLLLLQGVVALVLLIAAANVANLLLVRLVGRQKELAVRQALGASRGRLARQVLIEAVLIALAGGIAGLAFAMALMRVLPHIGLGQALSQFPVSMNLPVLGFSFGVSLIAGLLAALLPMLSLRKARLDESDRLGGGNRSAAVARNVLVVAQMALATALLIGAGLFLRSFVKLHDQSPGFTADGVLTAHISLTGQAHADHAARARFHEEVLREVRKIPGVESVGWTNVLPFGGTNSQGGYRIDGHDRASTPWGLHRTIDEDYFKVLRVPLITGRAFTAGDTADRAPVVIVDELLARKYFAGQDAVGQRIRLGSDADTPWATVIGVVGTTRHDSLRETVEKETLYWPFRQGITSDSPGTLVLRGPAIESPATVETLRETLRRIDPEQVLHHFMMLDDYIALTLQGQRAPMNLVGGVALLALVLSAAGIYAVLAFSTSQRSGEYGVRMALGAKSGQILALVLGQGATLTALGLAIGVSLAFAFGQWVQSQLFGISARDALIFGAVPALLACVALVACWIPARRAARVDPMTALRHE